MAPTAVGVVVWFSAIGIVGLLVVVRHVGACRRRAALGDQGDLLDLVVCGRGYLGSLVVCAAEAFLIKLRRADNLRAKSIGSPNGIGSDLEGRASRMPQIKVLAA
jgi:hypothetical protein